MEDGELVAKVQQGDLAAYEELVHRYQDIAFRTAYLVTGDPHEAEETAQDAFIKAFQAMDRFRKGAPFRPWLLRIVTNEARNRRRSAGRRTRLVLQVAGNRPSGYAAPSPELAALESETSAELMTALSLLDEKDRLVIAYRYFFEMSESEMAEALGCRRGTVKSRLSRALARLRDRLTAEDDPATTTFDSQTGERRG